MQQHTESDSESKHKKPKREQRNGSRRKGDNEELEDGELGKYTSTMLFIVQVIKNLFLNADVAFILFTYSLCR